MSIMETLAARRTYRRFAQKPVPQDVVEDMVEALRLSSCGANRQAVKLVVVQSPEMVAKVHPLVKWAGYLPPEQGTPKADELPTLYVAVVQRHPRRPQHRHRHRAGQHHPCRVGQGRGQLHHGCHQQARPERAAGHRRPGQAGLHGGAGLPLPHRQGRAHDRRDGHQILSGRGPQLLCAQAEQGGAGAERVMALPPGRLAFCIYTSLFGFILHNCLQFGFNLMEFLHNT